MQSAAELTFDADSHVYRYAGRVVPSVTQVLSILNDFSNVDGELLEAARTRGRHVHAMIDLENRGQLDEEALDGELLPYLDQWRLFLRESGFIVTASETQVYHKALGYAGTADVGSMQGTSWVLDIKTGSMPRSVGAQLAAYQQALEPRPRRRLCLILNPDGYRLHECKRLSDFSLFQSCLNIWRFQNAA
jgi:hypothetical protein